MPDTRATRHPLFWAALAFAAGIEAGVHLWRPQLWWLIAAGVFLLAAGWFRSPEGWRNQFAYSAAFVALAVLGTWSVQASDAAFRLPDISRFTGGDEVVVTAYAAHDGILRGQGAWQRQSVDLETEEITSGSAPTPVVAGLRLTIYGRGERRPAKSEQPEDTAEGGEADAKQERSLPLRVFTAGERLRFPVKLRAPRNFRNPGAWDYRGYLLKHGILATGTVAADKVELLPGLAGSPFARWSGRARRAIITKVHLLWRPELDSDTSTSAGAGDNSWPQTAARRRSRFRPLRGDQAALFDAMLIGERSFIGRETNEAWQKSGIYHILVVSGMNIGIVALFVFGMLRRIRAGEWLATLLTIVLACGYAWLAELGAPVLRSVLMLSVFLFTRLLYRDRSLLNAIGAAALVLLATDPRSLFDASFQLTFLAVVAIAGLAVPVLERTSQPYRQGLGWPFSPEYDMVLAPSIAQLRLDLRLTAQRMARLLPISAERGQRAAGWVLAAIVSFVIGIYEVIVVSTSAQLAMTLPMAIYFHRATLVGLAANTIAVPLTGILMMGSALAVALAFLWLPLARIPAMVAGWCLTGITSTIHVLGRMDIANLRLPLPSQAQALAAGATVALAMIFVRRRRVLALAGVAALIASTVWITAFPPPPQVHPGALEITGIDVGQAESTLVVTPEGRTLLVDAAGSLGPFHTDFDLGADVIAPYLWARDIRRIDALALTHAHSDHMGGMPAIIANFHPRELWLGPNANTPELRRLLRTARKAGVIVVPRRSGQQFDFGGAHVEVLAPPPDWQPKDKPRNNDSMVLRISLGKTSALLTADAEKKIERYLVTLNPRATLLKVGHNGSATSTTPEFLAAVQPRFALISVGAHNSFHHPRPEVLQRLVAAHVLTYRTDKLGAVTFLMDGKTVFPMPEVLRQPR